MCQRNFVHKIETHFVPNNVPPPPKNCAVLEVIWKMWMEAADDNMTAAMRFACRVTKATGTRSQYVILLFQGNSGYANAPPY